MAQDEAPSLQPHSGQGGWVKEDDGSDLDRPPWRGIFRRQWVVERRVEDEPGPVLFLVVYLVWCGVVWCGVVWLLCGVVCRGVVWCDAVRCGVVLCGAVWCGVVRCGEVRCGVMRCIHCVHTTYTCRDSA